MNEANRKRLQEIKDAWQAALINLLDKYQAHLVLMLDAGVGYLFGAVGMAAWELMTHWDTYLQPGGWKILLSTIFGAGMLTGTTHLRQKAKGLSRKEPSS